MAMAIDPGDGRVHETVPATDTVITKRRIKKLLDRCNQNLSGCEQRVLDVTAVRDAEKVTRDMYQSLYDAAAPDP